MHMTYGKFLEIATDCQRETRVYMYNYVHTVSRYIYYLRADSTVMIYDSRQSIFFSNISMGNYY